MGVAGESFRERRGGFCEPPRPKLIKPRSANCCVDNNPGADQRGNTRGETDDDRGWTRRFRVGLFVRYGCVSRQESHQPIGQVGGLPLNLPRLPLREARGQRVPIVNRAFHALAIPPDTTCPRASEQNSSTRAFGQRSIAGRVLACCASSVGACQPLIGSPPDERYASPEARMRRGGSSPHMDINGTGGRPHGPMHG